MRQRSLRAKLLVSNSIVLALAVSAGGLVLDGIPHAQEAPSELIGIDDSSAPHSNALDVQSRRLHRLRNLAWSNFTEARAHPVEPKRFANNLIDYQLDDGVSEVAVGSDTPGADKTWYVSYTVLAGKESIAAIYADVGIIDGECDGLSITVAVLSDPNQDGNPTDGAVLGSITSVTEDTGDSDPQLFVFPAPVNAGDPGDVFFLAASVTQTAECGFPASQDQTNPVSGRNWFGDGLLTSCDGVSGCPVDALSEDLCPSDCPGNWLLRAQAIPPVCGDGVCNQEETCDCATDCTIPGTETVCVDGLDEDCDGLVDCVDPDCDTDPACCADCPADSAPESEALCADDYVDTFNGGCNSQPYVWSAGLEPDGPAVCGTSGKYRFSCGADSDCGEGQICDVSSGRCRSSCTTLEDCPLGQVCEVDGRCTGDLLLRRDTDWFHFSVSSAEGGQLATLCGEAEFEFVLLLFDDGQGADCDSPTFFDFSTFDECSTGCISACLDNGTYTAFIAPSFEDRKVSCGFEYELSLTFEDCPPESCPIVDSPSCQLPNQSTLWTSDVNQGFQVAENFVAQSDFINQVCWWGTYFESDPFMPCTPSSADSFRVTYYLDDAGGTAPGTLLAGPYAVSPDTSSTGLFIGSSGSYPEFAYSTTHSPVAVSPGQVYWISVENNLTGDCRWAWESSVGDGAAWQSGNQLNNSIAVCVDQNPQGNVIFVDGDARGAATGTSWLNAFTDLQTALSFAEEQAPAQIWVAATSEPYRPAGPGGERTLSFELLDNVEIYGGFNGTELLLEQRDPQANVTILSGDLNGDDLADLPGYVACYSGPGEPAAPGCESFDVDMDTDVDDDDAPSLDDNSYHVVTASGVGASAVLDGVTITAGNAYDPAGLAGDALLRGGGARLDGASPTLRGCRFLSNKCDVSGGAVAVVGATSPTIEDCAFEGNLAASSAGGALFNDGSSPNVDACSFENNRGQGGGAVFNLVASAEFRDCSFDSNQVINPDVSAPGGAIVNADGNISIEQCSFSGNSAQRGGALSHADGTLVIVDSTFTGNSATNNGGAIEGGGTVSADILSTRFLGNVGANGGAISVQESFSALLANCVFSGNQASGEGGAIRLVTSMAIVNSSFTANTATVSAGGLHVGAGMATVDNSIFWNNGGTTSADQINGTATVNYSLVQGGWGGGGGAGIQTGDPLFANAAGVDSIPGTPDDDLRLASGSPAIDAGDNMALPADTQDLDGNMNTGEDLPLDIAGVARRLEDHLSAGMGNGAAPFVDMGAFEFLRDCNNNGLPDGSDLASCAGDPGCADCNGNMIPDACDIAACDLGTPGTPGDCSDISGPNCNDCNLNGVPDCCDIDSGGSSDLNGEGVPDECIEFDGDCLNNEWTCPTNWSFIDGYPDNQLDDPDAVAGQHATINGSTVFLDDEVEVQTLLILNGGILEVTQVGVGDLFVVDAGGVLLQGTLFIDNDRRVLVTTGPFVIDEGGSFEGAPVPALPGGASGTLQATQIILNDAPCDATASLTASGTMLIDGGVLILNGVDPQDPGCCPPDLIVLDSASLTIGDFNLLGDGGVAYASLEPLDLEGDFVNQSQAPLNFDWIGGGICLGTCGVGDAVFQLQTFEVAGEDRGSVPAGLVDNFAFGDMIVDAGADVTFSDTYDNDAAGQGPCTEALYVKSLTLEAGSTIRLDEVTLYYEALDDQGATVVKIGCGDLVPVCLDSDADDLLDDVDADGVCDALDRCAGFSDGDDADNDGVPDACDPCPLDNPDDPDADGVCSAQDLCPGFSDAFDADGDGVPDGCDICAGPDFPDTDGDGVPDACDPCPLDDPDDSDGDGICDAVDACPDSDDTIDTDNDGLPDGCDLCPAEDCSTLDDQCARGVCNEGTGMCEAQPIREGLFCDDGNACLVGETCQSMICTGGLPLNCSIFDDQCTQGVCNAATGLCELQAINDAQACDDGLMCTTGDTCQAGVCGGTVVDCSSLTDDCNLGTCNVATGACEAVAANEGESCEDGDLCTAGETCSAGSCSGAEPVDCAGLDDQCRKGVCNPLLGICEPNPINEDQTCEDGDLCTSGETCQSGICLGAEAVDCSGLDDQCNAGVCNAATGACETMPVNEGLTCEDGNLCTEGETCQAGACLGATPVDCSGLSDQCNNGVCNVGTGACEAIPVNEGLTCEDGDLCTTGETCQSGACLGAGPVDCSAVDDQCNVGVCNARTGDCEPQPANEGLACDDGNACTADDLCVTGACLGGDAPDCDDGNDCTTDSCDPATGCQNDCLVSGTGCDPGNGGMGECTEACTCVLACPLGTVAECSDLDGDDIRDDGCVFWECIAGLCVATDIVYAEMGGSFGACNPDGASDGNDRFHALNCFANTDPNGGGDYPCEPAAPAALNVDAGGQFGSCNPDGVCDGNDAFAALNAFSNETTCSCGSGPSPAWPGTPGPRQQAAIQLQSDRDTIRPSGSVVVDVMLASSLKDLRGYQLHLEAVGGTRGRLELVDIVVHDVRNHVFVQQNDWRAFNTSIGQMVAGLDSAGVAVESGSYLGSFIFEASLDAAGGFTIELLADPDDPQQRTFLMPTHHAGRIDILNTGGIQVRVRSD